MSLRRCLIVQLVLAVLVVSWACMSALAQKHEGDDRRMWRLYVGYKLPEAPDTASDARNLEAKCSEKRTVMIQVCRQGEQSMQCLNDAELSFRQCILGIKGAQFWLAACPKELCKGVSLLFPLLGREVTSLELSPKSEMSGAGRSDVYFPTDAYFDRSQGCTPLTAESKPLRGIAFGQEICQILSNLEDDPENDSLHNAIRQEQRTLVNFLLSRGVGVGFAHLDAGLYRSGPIFEMLLATGGDANARDEKIFVGSLERGTARFVKGKDGVTILFSAAFARRTDAVKLLLSRGADPNVMDYHGRTALHAAAQSLYPQMISLLISAGADVIARDNDGWTPLHRAVVSYPHFEQAEDDEWRQVDKAQDKLGTIKVLVARGANVNMQGPGGQTPLHLAISSLDAVKLLISLGARVNSRDDQGETPLHKAASYSNPRVVKYLVAQGAFPNARDKNGRTPLDLAKERNAKSVVEQLRKILKN